MKWGCIAGLMGEGFHLASRAPVCRCLAVAGGSDLLDVKVEAV